MLHFKDGTNAASIYIYQLAHYYPPQSVYEQGVTLTSLKIERQNPNAKFINHAVRARVTDILQNKNILLVSGTGSGKTEAAYFHIFKNIQKGVLRQVLAVYPTNILAHQQFDRINKYANLFGFSASFLAS